MNEEEYRELVSRGEAACKLVSRGKIIAAFRPATFEEASEEVASEGNPALSELRLAEACLVWPSSEEFRKLYTKFPGVPQQAATAIRSVSGGQCGVTSMDEESCTFSVQPKAKDEEEEPEPQKVFVVSALNWPQMQRFRAALQKSDKLAAYRTACVDAGTWPESRDDRKAVFDVYPYLAKTAATMAFHFSSGDTDIEGN